MIPQYKQKVNYNTNFRLNKWLSYKAFHKVILNLIEVKWVGGILCY